MDITRPADRLFDYDVVDSAGQKIGSINNVWVDEETSSPKFLGAQTGWLVTHTYVVPAEAAQIDDEARAVRLPYAQDFVKNAPTLSSGALLTDDDQRKIFGYYGAAPLPAAPSFVAPAVASGAERVAAYAQNDVAAVDRQAVAAADRVETYAQQNAAAGYDRAPVNAADTIVAPAAAAGAQNTVQDTAARAPEPQVVRQPIETVDAGPVSAAASGIAGEMQIRKVVRRERIYVPVDVDREYVEVVPASEVGNTNTNAQTNSGGQQGTVVSETPVNRNANESAQVRNSETGSDDTRRST